MLHSTGPSAPPADIPLLRLHDPDDPAQRERLRTELAAGLQATPARVSPKFFYDALGSRLFDAITLLPEYGPTRQEAAVFAAHGAAIAEAVHAAVGPAPTLVDLGAGDCAKAEALLGPLRVSRYVALDIALPHLLPALRRLQRAHPTLALQGVALDFSARLALPPGLLQGPAVVFYPGSSIGNFAPDAAERLLREARELAAGGALLVGADRVKPAAELEAAYDDAIGLTAAFNRNMLRHVNRLLGSDFQPAQWRHRARWNGAQGCVQMHLMACGAQQVRWPGGERRFADGEALHTEDSHKWTPEAFASLLRRAGWGQVQAWGGPEAGFGVFLASG